jgi:hypothetical protein
LIANLYLGQINTFLVVFMGEFVLNLLQDRRWSSGAWLSLLLIKPHTLILLIPGLALSQNWGVLSVFALGAGGILAGSLLIAGIDGLIRMSQLTYQFAGPLIQTASGMMNWRSLALNLETLIPSWLSWPLAGLVAALAAGLVLNRWLKSAPMSPLRSITRLALTIFGTLIVSWHAHFYMHVLLVPLLLALHSNGSLPKKLRVSWLLGPPLIYFTAYLVCPDLARDILGVSMLALNLYFLVSLRRDLLDRDRDYRGFLERGSP